MINKRRIELFHCTYKIFHILLLFSKQFALLEI